MKSVVTVEDKETGKTDLAIYAPNKKGNKQYNVAGKFYTDKAFDKKFKIVHTCT